MSEALVTGKNRMVQHSLFFCLLFLVSFLVFDTSTLMLGVSVALFALYYFSRKWAERRLL